MSFSKRFDSSSVCYTKPIDSLKHWNDHFFWVDAFACSASYPWHTDKNVSRDPLPKSTEFNVDRYAFLVAHPAPFQKFLFLAVFFTYLFVYVDMDLFALIQVADPTKVKVVVRERADGEAKLLDSTVGRVVPLLPVASAHAESELEASVDKLFDEGGSTEQEDSADGGGHDAEIELVTAVEDTAAGNVIVERPKHPRKKRPAVTDASGRESGDPADSITGINLHTIGPIEKFVISSDSSHHSSTNAYGAEVDSIIRTRTEYCLSERKRLEFECEKQADLLKARDVEIKNRKAHLLVKEAEATKAPYLFVQVSAIEAAEKVRADVLDDLKQRNVTLGGERDSLNEKITELQSSVSTKDFELKDFNVTVSSLRSQNDGLVHALEATCSGLRDQVSRYERLKEQIKESQDIQMNILND
uniref:Transposase (Putative), gypsy type n=1 Tax=Tanacetum cinerariifolium TaxID=118510 RepID=A0A699HJR9_TANCI|nr:hypothetical protein [Tanacetum cinerariifolium]